MLEPAAFQEIQGFLLLVEQPDLFAYLQLERDVSASKIKSALRRRRSWAQGQQANPKYRTEALWLIKNIKLVQTALTTEKESYLQESDELLKQRHVAELRLFIQEALVDGTLPSDKESEVFEQAESLEIPEAEVNSHIELVLTALDQGLLAELPMKSTEEPRDHYEVLGVAPGSDQETLEAAYRERYRWARNLRDTEESSRIYAELDAAWRVLKDPDRRAVYNESVGGTAPEAAAPAPGPEAAPTSTQAVPDQIGFLPPPPPEIPSAPEVPAPPQVPEPGPPEAATPEAAEPASTQAPTPPVDPAPEIPKMEIEDTSELDPLPDDTPAVTAADESQAEIEAAAGPQPASTDEGTNDLADPLDGIGPTLLDIGELDDEALPILKVHGPTTIRIRTGNNPFPVRVQIENVGRGQMSGSVHSSADWVEISPKHLNPNRTEHSIELLVDPEKMPSNAAQTTIEITTGHGESAEIVVDALQHLVSPMMKVVTALALVLGIGAAVAVYLLGGDMGTTAPPPPRTILAVHVDPPAGEVYVGDVMVGKQGTLSMVDNFPINKSFQVRVELDGFEPWTKTVIVEEGQQLRVEAELVLRDPMDFAITPDMRRSEIDQAAFKAELDRRSESFQNCFTRHLQPDSAYNAALTLRGTVSQRGYVSAVEFRGANFESDDVNECLKRQLRGLKLPVLPGDYAIFDHTFRTRVGPRHTPVDIEANE